MKETEDLDHLKNEELISVTLACQVNICNLIAVPLTLNGKVEMMT